MREVEVVVPAPRRIHLPAGTRSATLLDGGRTVAAFRDGGDLLTDAVGRVTLRFTDAPRRTKELALDLPATPASEITADPAAATELRGDVEVRVLHPAEDGTEAVYETVTRHAGQELVVEREGWRTLRWTAADGDVLRWGNAAVEFSVTVGPADGEGALALVDGELYEVEDGRLALRGLHPGPHRAILALRDRPGTGRELRFSLGSGETLEHPVDLSGE